MQQRNQRNQQLPKANPSDIFGDAEDAIRDLIDPEDIINIDFDGLEESAKAEAEQMIDIVSHFYYDEEFMKAQPKLKNRIESDLESLRINLKMRKADEMAHDILLKNIGQNPSNASMYKALTELQKTILSITTKIEDTVTKLTNLLKGYQTEINFDQPETTSDSDPTTQHNVHRGSKSFIDEMSALDDDDVDIPEDEDD